MAKKSKEDSASLNVDDVLKEMNKKHKGKLKLGTDIVRGEKRSTGSLLMDKALNGGYIEGKIIEVFGPESIGKSALAYTFLSQIKDGVIGFVDGESAYERETAEMYNVDCSRLVVSQPFHIEEGLQDMMDMIDEGAKAIVFDSIAGIPPKAELEGDMEDTAVGKKAYRMNQAMRQLHSKARDAGCTCLFINQVRESMNMFEPVTTPGGKAVRFHATYRWWAVSKKALNKANPQFGHYINLRLFKNKVGLPDIKLSVPLVYGYGISPAWEIMDLALEANVLTKSGTWISHNGETIAQGEFNTFQAIMDNPDFFEELKKELGL